MFKQKYIFTFILITFLLLSITGAGIFVDDEWASAQQLRQLSDGHQITINEGPYGYYANGTMGNYFDYRDGRLMYSMALPIISLPFYGFIKLSGDYFRIFYVTIWTLLGILICYYLYSMRKINKLYMQSGIGMILLLTLLNIYLYKDFQITGKFTPSEVLAIVSTNILLFGIFTVFIHKIIDRIFDDNKLKAFTFISILSCTSLLFWVGTCKDHILSVLIATIIIYCIIKYEQEKSMTALSLGLFLAGLMTWVRIEFGAGIVIGCCIYLVMFHFNDILSGKLVLGLSLFTGTIPLWINNYITTGSPIVHPFTLAVAKFGSQEAMHESIATTMGVGITHPVESLLHMLFSPQSGAISLLVIIPLVAIIIPAYIFKRIKLTRFEILFLIMAFCSVLYYIRMPIFYMSADTGIMPDMRYFIFFYTLITLFIISLLSRIKPELPYKKMIIYYVLTVSLLFILFTSYAATISHDGTYRDLDRIVNTLTAVTMGVGAIVVINDIRLNKNNLQYILPIMIAVPMAWQLVMLFIYHTSKAHAYPMFIPITEFIYNNIFGLIL